MVLRGYDKYLQALDERLEKGETTPENKRTTQEAVYEELYDYAREKTPDFPREIAGYLAFAMRDVLDGFTPGLFETRRGRGRRVSPTVEDCIADARHYIACCDAGLIDDPHPRKTVADCYGVKASTVSTWLKRYGDIDIPRHDQTTAQDMRRVRALMEFSGRHYPKLPSASSHGAMRTRKETSEK